MVALLILVGVIVVVAFFCALRVRDPHHDFMLDLVRTLDADRGVGDEEKNSARAASRVA